jgi:hypothetical protein
MTEQTHYQLNRDKILAQRRADRADPVKHAAELERARLHRLNNPEVYAARRQKNTARKKQRMENGDLDAFVTHQHQLLRKTYHTPGRVARGITVEITKEELKQWLIDNPKCVYSGREVVFKMNDRNKASLDRKDNALSYTLDNVQMTATVVNQAKMDMSEQEFLQMCFDVAMNYGYQPPKP